MTEDAHTEIKELRRVIEEQKAEIERMSAAIRALSARDWEGGMPAALPGNWICPPLPSDVYTESGI